MFLSGKKGAGVELLDRQVGGLPNQFFQNLRNENRVGTTRWEKSTKLQNLVFLLVKNLGFAHPVFTRFHRPWNEILEKL